MREKSSTNDVIPQPELYNFLEAVAILSLQKRHMFMAANCMKTASSYKVL